MAISSYVTTARAILDKSVASDMRTNRIGMEASLENMDDNREVLKVKTEEARLKAAEALEAAEGNKGFFGGIGAFVGFDGDAPELQKDAELLSADVDEATNLGVVYKDELKDVQGRFSDTIDTATRLSEGIDKALDFTAELRREG